MTIHENCQDCVFHMSKELKKPKAHQKNWNNWCLSIGGDPDIAKCKKEQFKRVAEEDGSLPNLKTEINAFHKDFVKTHMPEFLTKIRVESTQYSNGVINGGKSRASRESKHGQTVNTINVFPKTQKRVSTEITEFRIYSRAGAK